MIASQCFVFISMIISSILNKCVCSAIVNSTLNQGVSFKMSNPVFTKEELKKRLTPLQYHITQEKGTERQFTGEYNKHFDNGTYNCVVCDESLFSSEQKFDSSCGWPAFSEAVDNKKVIFKKDASLEMVRTEVLCASCGAHLGHVFNDGPLPKKTRYCINSNALKFHKAESIQQSNSDHNQQNSS